MRNGLHSQNVGLRYHKGKGKEELTNVRFTQLRQGLSARQTPTHHRRESGVFQVLTSTFLSSVMRCFDPAKIMSLSALPSVRVE